VKRETTQRDCYVVTTAAPACDVTIQRFNATKSLVINRVVLAVAAAAVAETAIDISAEQSGLLARIAATESVSLCKPKKS
jgi:hypothetical protein